MQHSVAAHDPVAGAVGLHALERGSVAVLVGGPVPDRRRGGQRGAMTPADGFFFTTAHYWTAWLAIGALLLLLHIAVQLPAIRRRLDRYPRRRPDRLLRLAAEVGHSDSASSAPDSRTSSASSRACT